VPGPDPVVAQSVLPAADALASKGASRGRVKRWWPRAREPMGLVLDEVVVARAAQQRRGRRAEQGIAADSARGGGVGLGCGRGRRFRDILVVAAAGGCGLVSCRLGAAAECQPFGRQRTSAERWQSGRI